MSKIASGTWASVYRTATKISNYKQNSFNHEVTMLKRFQDHANIVKYICHANNHEHGYIVMELMPTDLLTAPLPSNGIALRVMKQLLLALKFIHESGYYHGDVKPANVLFDPETCIAKLCDFGLCDETYTDDMSPDVCTLWYRPPELLLSRNYYYYGGEIGKS